MRNNGRMWFRLWVDPHFTTSFEQVARTERWDATDIARVYVPMFSEFHVPWKFWEESSLISFPMPVTRSQTGKHPVVAPLSLPRRKRRVVKSTKRVEITAPPAAYQVLSGKDVQHLKLYKILNETWIHKGFQYKEGLNVLIEQFSPHGQCNGGGLYVSWLPEKYIDYGQTIADVTLPDDTKVWMETNKLKVDRLVLSNPRPISYELYWKAMSCDYMSLSDVPVQFRDEKLCWHAISNGMCLSHVPEQFRDEKLCSEALRKSVTCSVLSRSNLLLLICAIMQFVAEWIWNVFPSIFLLPIIVYLRCRYPPTFSWGFLPNLEPIICTWPQYCNNLSVFISFPKNTVPPSSILPLVKRSHLIWPIFVNVLVQTCKFEVC